MAEETALIRSDVVAARVITDLDLNRTPQQLTSHIRVASTSSAGAQPATVTSNTLLTIAYESDSAVEAAKVVTDIAKQYISSRGANASEVLAQAEHATQIAIQKLSTNIANTSRQLQQAARNADPSVKQSLSTSLAAMAAQLETLQQRAAELVPNAAVNSGAARVLQTPDHGVRTNSAPRQLGIALIVGLTIAVLTVLLLDRRADRFLTTHEVTDLGLPVLSWIASSSQDSAMRSRRRWTGAPQGAEGFSRLRNVLVASSVGDSIKSLAIATPTPLQDECASASQLLAALEQAGLRTTLVRAEGSDTNPRIASEPIDSEFAPLDNLSVLSQTVRQLVVNNDVVILDTPSIVENPNAAAATMATDATVVVLDAAKTHKTDARFAVEELLRMHRPILGIVVLSADSLTDARRALPRGSGKAKTTGAGYVGTFPTVDARAPLPHEAVDNTFQDAEAGDGTQHPGISASAKESPIVTPLERLDADSAERPEDASSKVDGAIDSESNDRGGSKHRRRSRLRRFIVGLVVVLLLALVVDAGASVVLVRSSLHQARTSLVNATRDLNVGKVDAAAAAVRSASSSSSHAGQWIKQPGYVVAEHAPWLNAYTAPLRGLTAAAVALSSAGGFLVRAAETVGLGSQAIPSSTFSNGTFHLPVFQTAAGQLTHAESLLTNAKNEVSRARSIAGTRLSQDLTHLSTNINRQRSTVSNATALLASLPGVLGGTEPRTYLLIFQALGESRGTGGVAGLYGVLNAESGRIHLGHMGSYGEIQRGHLTKVAAPNWFETFYGPQFGTEHWAQANLSPNFPVVAHVMQEMYSRDTGRAVDGVIALDPVALQETLRALGKVTLPRYGVQLTSKNAARVLMYDSYVRFPNASEQNAFLSAAVRSFWNALVHAHFDTHKFVESLGTAIKGGHVKFWFSRPEEQGVVRRLAADGDPTSLPEPLQMVWSNNYSANKVDYFVHRQISTIIDRTDASDATVTTTVNLTNNAPSQGAPALLGPQIPGEPPGTDRITLNFLIPKGATPLELLLNQEQKQLTLSRDSGHDVAWTKVEIAPGGNAGVTLKYRLPINADSNELNFTLVPQTTSRPDAFTLRVLMTTGRLVSAEGATLSSPTEASTDGFLQRPVSVHVQFQDQP
ncbi:MAG: DUF4012 domain-containing protein [Actinomycetota bacterium]|nr:DUF4012 domain-containing protein [Actinomycetota bacterium]